MTQPLASEDRIRAHIKREYPMFKECYVSLGVAGGKYRVIVIDAEGVRHTFRFTDEDLARGQQ
jgi:hypothetical protein